MGGTGRRSQRAAAHKLNRERNTRTERRQHTKSIQKQKRQFDKFLR